MGPERTRNIPQAGTLRAKTRNPDHYTGITGPRGRINSHFPEFLTSSPVRFAFSLLRVFAFSSAFVGALAGKSSADRLPPVSDLVAASRALAGRAVGGADPRGVAAADWGGAVPG